MAAINVTAHEDTNLFFIRTGYARRVLIALALAGGIATGAASTALAPAVAYADEADDCLAIQPISDEAVKNEAVSELGEFAGFGLVGFDDVELHSRANSNIATPDLDAGGQGFGTNDVAKPEQSLIGRGENMTQVSTANGSGVVMGSDTEVSDADAPNAKMVNGAKVTLVGGTADSLVQGEMPNFSAWQRAAGAASSALSALPSEAAYDDRDMNRREVQAPASGASVVNVDAASLTSCNTEIHVRGLVDGMVVINIDAVGLVNLNLPSIIANDDSNHARSEWSAYGIVLNVFDSTAHDGMFRGTLTFSGRVTAIILAPCATVNVQHSVDGQILAAHIAVSGEFNRNTFASPDSGVSLNSDLPASFVPDAEAETAEGPVAFEALETPIASNGFAGAVPSAEAPIAGVPSARVSAVAEADSALDAVAGLVESADQPQLAGDSVNMKREAKKASHAARFIGAAAGSSDSDDEGDVGSGTDASGTDATYATSATQLFALTVLLPGVLSRLPQRRSSARKR